MNMKLTKSILRNLIKEELVAVKGGLGSMRLDQIQTDLRRKLEDLLARADAGAYHTIGKNELDVLSNMWLTVSEAIPRDLDEQDEERIKLQQRGITKGAQAQQLRQTAKGVQTGEIGGEFTNIERSLVQQIATVITDIASAPDVDLGQYRSQVNTILNRLKKMTGAVTAGSGQEQEEA
jgi:hypothetical protein